MADNYQEITGDGPVLRMLDRIRERRSLIHVRIQNKNNPWNSAIIAVDINQKTWQFDELPSDEASRLLLKERKCGVEARLEGVKVTFQTTVTGSGSDEKGLVYYEASVPRSIRIYQRRGTFRAPLSSAQRATVHFSAPGGTMVRGRIQDISLGGIRINLTQWTLVGEAGFQIPNVSINLPNGKRLYCDLKICFLQRRSSDVSIGARFVNMSRADQKEITRFVAALDRENAKRAHARSSERTQPKEPVSEWIAPAASRTSVGRLMAFLTKIKNKIIPNA